MLVLLPPGPLIYSSSAGCFCHPVTGSPALTFYSPAMAAGPWPHVLAPVLCSRKDRNDVRCGDEVQPCQCSLSLPALRGQPHGPCTPGGTRASPRGCGVSLHFGGLLDFCFSSARSRSHPPDLMLPLDNSELCYGDGETEAGRGQALPCLHSAQPPCHGHRGITPSPTGPTRSWG